MSLPFKIKKMAISEVDSSLLIDEVVSSIAKIKKQKQRPNTERIFSMMVKSHPELTLPCLNEAVERAIQDGLVVNYLHNGVYSYRVVPTSSESVTKFVSDRNVEEAVKWLFYDGKPREFTMDELECSVRQRFPAGSLFSSCLRDVIANACGELVQLGELTYAKGVYAKNSAVHEEEDIKQFDRINNNNNIRNSLSCTPRDCNALQKKDEPPDIKSEITGKKKFDIKRRAESPVEDLKMSDDVPVESSKESFSNLQSPSSEASSDRPKKKKARSLQVSFLFDSLSNFFSVSGEKRRASRSAADKSNNSDTSQGSKSSRHSTTHTTRSHVTKSSKSASNKKASNSSDWQEKSSPQVKKKSKVASKNTSDTKKTSPSNVKVNNGPQSVNFQRVPSTFHSKLEELDFNEVNLACLNADDQDFFVNHSSTNRTINTNQSIDIAFGRFLLIITNMAALPKIASKSKRLVMCEFCLHMMESSRSLERHLMKCGLHCPPGSEMYRLNDLKLFHLSGRDQPAYSRRLCHLIQLLCVADPPQSGDRSKSIEKDLSPVPSAEESNYFILTIQDRSGSHLAGILSYHDMLDGYWTVTCLFVLPQYRNQGHAKCLVSLVYRMASMQSGRVVVRLKIPLKNHVLNLFQSVWRSLIVDHIIVVEAGKLHFRLDEISRATSIDSKDVSSSLTSLKMESDFYFTEQAVDMTHSQKEEMKRSSDSHLLLSGLEKSFSTKCCGNVEQVTDVGQSASDDFDGTSYQKRHAVVSRSLDARNPDVLSRLWTFLSSLGLETDAKAWQNDRSEIQDQEEEEEEEKALASRKRKNEDFHHNDGGNVSKRFHSDPKDVDDSLYQTPEENNHTYTEQDKTPDASMVADTPADHSPSEFNDTTTSLDVENKPTDRFATGVKNSDDQVEGPRSDGDMPSLDDLAATPSTAASSICVTMSSPSPPDLKRENNGGLQKDEVTVVSSVRSDHSELDVGGPICSPVKGQSSFPSSIKNVASNCSVVEEEQDRPINSNSRNASHDDDDCTVVAIETAADNPCSTGAEPIAGFNHGARHYHHHHHHHLHDDNSVPDNNNGMEKRPHPPAEHERTFFGDAPQYPDVAPKHHHQPPPISFYNHPARQDNVSYNRQCQSVAPVNCTNNNNSGSNKSGGKSKKSSKLPEEDGGFFGDRMNEKILSGMNSMQERCNSVFVDPGHYPPLPFNQIPGNSQLFQRPNDYIDGRMDRPATRCGFEGSVPQHFNAEFPPRFVTPHPPNPLEPNVGYQMQDRNLQSGCLPVPKLNQSSSYGSSRSQQSAMSNKTSKRANKSQGAVPPACYAASKSSNVLTNSPTIGGTLPMSSEPLLNAIYRIPNMTQGFEIPSPGYGLPNRFEANKPNFVPPNSYFGQQASSPGACQIQSHHNSTNQPHSQHVGRGNSNNGNATDPVLHHRPLDESSHQQALFLQHQRQQQAAYLNPAAYLAKLHQFHSDFGQFQYPAPFHSSSSPTPIDMSLHVPPRPSPVDGKSALLGMQQHRDSFADVDFFQSYKMFNLGPYAGSVDPRNIVHRNPQNQVGMFSHQQQPQVESTIQSPYAYLNGGNRNDLFSNSNLGDLMRK